MNNNFTEKLRVDKRIVDLLSKSTYQKSFASAIRELVSNAYDADALAVNIKIDENYSSITIEDDGNGMSRDEFGKYLTIAGVKTSMEFTRRFKRKRIGQFGVGFLAIFPFCETLELVTTVENSDEVLTAKIPTIEYSKLSNKQFVDEVPIPCTITLEKSQRLKHFTKITFIEPSYNVKQYFSKIETRKRESIITYDPFDKFIWELQEDLPISFNPDGNSYDKIKYIESIGINVTVNGKTLYRNELQDVILEKNNVEISGIKCDYIFSTNYKSIRPLEARSMKRRVNNVGIGGRTDFELKRDRGFSRLHWISGEIYYSENIKEHLTLSRDSFVLNPIVDELNEFFATKLRQWAYYVENVSIAEKEIEQSFQNTKKGSTIPKEEIIQKNLKKLTDKGFSIVHKIIEDIKSNKESPISLNKEEKTITIFNNPEIKKDFILINEINFEVKYTSEGFKENDPPCKLIKPDLCELNSDYQLFKSKTYGNLFKKIHILLAIAESKNKSAKGMYEQLIKTFLKEFDLFK